MEQKTNTGRKGKKKRKSIRKKDFHGMMILLGMVIFTIFNFVLLHQIGMEGMGYFYLGISWFFLLASIVNLAIPVVFSKIIYAKQSRGQYQSIVKFISGVPFVILVFTLIIGVINFVFADWISEMLFHSASLTSILRVVSFILLSLTGIQIINGYFQGFGSDIPSGFSFALEQFLLLIFGTVGMIIFYKKGIKISAFLHDESYTYTYGLSGCFSGICIAMLIVMLLLVLIFKQHFRSVKKMEEKNSNLHMDTLFENVRKYFFAYLPLQLFLIMIFVSKIICVCSLQSQFKDASALKDGMKQWGAYWGTFKLWILLFGAVLICLFRKKYKSISALYIKKELSDMKRKLSVETRNLMIFAFFFAVVLIVLAKPITQLISGEMLPVSTALLQLGGIEIVFIAVCMISGYLLIETGFVNHFLISTGIMSVVRVLVFFLILKTNLQIQAVVIADVAAYIIFASINLFTLQKCLHYRQNFIVSFLLPLVSAIISGIVLFLLQFLFGKAPLIDVILSLIIGIAVYFICLVALKVIQSEELYDLPKGDVLVYFAKILHILS